uniref:Uncharacterized protein n=1 Tax=Cacopsylla melanoneura TaxID=428564 RepID=A0A8D8TH01_9HEMI
MPVSILRSVISGIRNKLMKIIQIIHCRFLKDENRVTKYLNIELKLLSMVGLFQLPNSLPGQSTLQWGTGNSIAQSVTNARSTLYKLYMGFSFSFYATFLILIYICILTKSSKEFIEFFTAMVELLGMTMIFAELIIFNSNRSKLIDLLERMDKFDVRSQGRIFTSCRRLERLIWFGCKSGLVLMFLLKFSVPFFPIDAQSAAHVQSIYGFKYPKNRLPLCLGIPFVDTSEPKWFYVLYVLEIYAGRSEEGYYPAPWLKSSILNFLSI